MKKQKNFLDFIHIKNPDIKYIIENNLVILEIKRNGIVDKFAQKVFKVPQKSNIKLDKYGSFVWISIDNKKNVFDISNEVSNHFGKDAEPVLDRLVEFFNILNDNKFITFSKKE